MAVIAMLEQLGQSDGLMSLVSAGGPTGAIALFLWHLRPLAVKWFNSQQETQEELQRASMASERREERIVDLLETQPCRQPDFASRACLLVHPAPGGAGPSTPTQSEA